PPDLRLDAIEVSGQQQVRLPVPVEVARQDPVDGGELGLERQRDERERAVAVVARQRGREGTRLFDDRAGQLRGREDVGHRLPGVVLIVEVTRLEIWQRPDQVV